jgi:ferric-dicitrate binding protein FerR (iron transport regulator)
MPVAQRERLLDEFERSGLSGTKFAALAGIKYQTFATWAQRRRRQRAAGGAVKVPAGDADKVRWMEAVIDQAQTSAGGLGSSVVLELPGGARVELSDLKQVGLAVALVRALAQPPLPC